MTDLVLRNLSHNAHTREPIAKADHDEWWIEQVIEWAHSYDEPSMLDCILWLRPDLCSSELAEKVIELLDLSDEIACQSTRSDRWHAAVDEYAALLTSLATRPSGPTFDQEVDRALAVQDPVTSAGLTLVKQS